MNISNTPEVCQIIIKNTDDKMPLTPGENIHSARKNIAEAMVDKELPMVSIFVVAYNNIEKYTKRCIECILKYTKNVNYELVLVDNGSTDGTFEYFKSVNHPRKKIIHITKNIGSPIGAYQGFLNSESKYVVYLPNDIFVTENWLSNILKCAESDVTIGMVITVSDSMSNYQSVNLGYKDFDDMQLKAESYNISDAKKWEERLRLVMSCTLFKKECLDSIGFMDYGFFHDFGDDDMAFRVRRAGYKAMLCRDTFVCHAGEISDKGAETSRQSLITGRETFKNKYFGIDAWDDIQYEWNMVQCVENKERFKEYTPLVLGVDVGCGASILQAKNKLRSEGIFDTKLSAFSTEAKYWLDLKTICEDLVVVDRIDFILEHFQGKKFDCILIGKAINDYKDPYKVINDILKILNEDGQIILKIKNNYDITTLLKIVGINKTINIENVCHFSMDELSYILINKAYFIKNFIKEIHTLDANLENTVESLNINFATENDYSKALVNNYICNIVKLPTSK